MVVAPWSALLACRPPTVRRPSCRSASWLGASAAENRSLESTPTSHRLSASSIGQLGNSSSILGNFQKCCYFSWLGSFSSFGNFSSLGKYFLTMATFVSFGTIFMLRWSLRLFGWSKGFQALATWVTRDHLILLAPRLGINADFARLIGFFPSKYLEIISKWNPKGDFNLNGLELSSQMLG